MEAAGEVFAEKGYRDTTVREICQQANANVAAVNYYFGDKQRLYADVLRYAHQCSGAARQSEIAAAERRSPEVRLQGFVEAFLGHIFNEGRAAWHGKLMAREMMEPTQALDALVEERVRPMAHELESITRELIGPEATTEQVRLCVVSVVGQCLHYHHSRPVICRLYPELDFGARDITVLVRHITRFSLSAIKSMASLSDDADRKGGWNEGQ